MPPKLDPAEVVRTALRLLNETGLEGLTLRRIATELKVQAPALYWHFGSKQALLDAMATQLFQEMSAEPWPAPEAGWREWVAGSCRNQRRVLLRYRDGAKVFSGTQLQGSEHAATLERVFAALVAAGFPLDEAVQAYATGAAYTVGFVIEEQCVHPLPGEVDARYDPAARAERIGGAYPLAARAGEGLFTGFDERFERGIAVLVAGLAATVPGIA
ncbi:TetR/AcrR family transcriptional regulator C-terminal domain-containing protein [Kitasatospora sp. NPDC006697]|uniref:TetR/AcrR family transcriptional regulator C-terminal domain-containing protein n=1 Tax=Kitasatospora sp. NPDC006697 TaxID=3364020 RepID=UPI0036B43413